MKKLKGTIISTKMTGTAVVRVDRLKKHPKYKKYFRVSKKFKAQVPAGGDFKEGDFVVISEIRPISKDKRWLLSQVVKRPLKAEETEENKNESEK